MITIGTLFSGGEGVGVGARNAGLSHLWGVEYDDQIAQVGRLNGFNTLTGDVRDAELMHSLPRPDVLHASPVCKNASNAKADGEESPIDIETADATCAYIEHLKPDIFTLENVYGYRTFTAFAHVLECLNRNHYHVDYWHLNAADYGVPQTRQRLILVARLHGKPRKPHATHARPDKLTPLFDDRLPWVGWYKAIEDLIYTLPASKFAKWQLERLPEDLRECAIFGNDQSDDRKGTEYGYGVINRREAEPAITLKTTYEPKAFIMAGGDEWTPPIDGSDPSFTLTDSRNNHPMCAFLTDAFNVGREMTIRDQTDPVSTIDAMRISKHPRLAWLSSGRVVKMTPRALARFQSFPDSYILPDKTKLACTVIGNAVPPLLYQRVIEAQINDTPHRAGR